MLSICFLFFLLYFVTFYRTFVRYSFAFLSYLLIIRLREILQGWRCHLFSPCRISFNLIFLPKREECLGGAKAGKGAEAPCPPPRYSPPEAEFAKRRSPPTSQKNRRSDNSGGATGGKKKSCKTAKAEKKQGWLCHLRSPWFFFCFCGRLLFRGDVALWRVQARVLKKGQSSFFKNYVARRHRWGHRRIVGAVTQMRIADITRRWQGIFEGSMPEKCPECKLVLLLNMAISQQFFPCDTFVYVFSQHSINGCPLFVAKTFKQSCCFAFYFCWQHPHIGVVPFSLSLIFNVTLHN